MEKSILDLIALWGKDHFKVNNILYEKDQALCAVLENAIWVRKKLLDCVQYFLIIFISITFGVAFFSYLFLHFWYNLQLCNLVL